MVLCGLGINVSNLFLSWLFSHTPVRVSMWVQALSVYLITWLAQWLTWFGLEREIEKDNYFSCATLKQYDYTSHHCGTHNGIGKCSSNTASVVVPSYQ